MRTAALRDESGFTLIEVLIAIVLLTVGVLGTFALVDNANGRTSDTKAREGATALARDLIESTRSVPFNDISDAGLPGLLQAKTGLADGDAASGWQISRRNFVYTVVSSVCTVDDASDNYGTAASHDSSFCAGTPSSTAADADRNPYDFKRVKFTVSWSDTHGTQRTYESTLINSTYRGPTATSINAAPNPLTSGDSIALTTVFGTPATSANWYVDGRLQGQIPGSNQTSWSWPWNLGPASCAAASSSSVQDGTYFLSAVGYDRNGATGGPKASTVTINRCAPFAPTGLAGGWNWGSVELTWAPNPESDVVGYDVLRGSTVVCSTSSGSDTSCRDTTADPAATQTYTVKAYDTDANSVRRPGPVSSSLTVLPNCGTGTCNTPPLTPDVTISGSTLSISTKPRSDPDSGDTADFFRVYRTTSNTTPPSGPSDRYDVVDNPTSGSTVTWTDPAPGSGYYYWVTAVDKHYTESAFSTVVP